MIRFLVALSAATILGTTATARADGTAGLGDFGSFLEGIQGPTPPPAPFPDQAPAPSRSQTTGGDSNPGAATSFEGAARSIVNGAQQMSAPFQRAGTAATAFQQWEQTNEALSDLDAELTSRLRDDGDGPDVPSSCRDENCSECFRRAYGEVNFTRIVLERLRTISHLTLNYIKNAESLGDTTSGIHGVTGLAWQYAKVGVEQQKTEFNHATRAKYDALIANMRRALVMVDACEQNEFHNADWFNRYGFMYLNFVKDAYKPDE